MNEAVIINFMLASWLTLDLKSCIYTENACHQYIIFIVKNYKKMCCHVDLAKSFGRKAPFTTAVSHMTYSLAVNAYPM